MIVKLMSAENLPDDHPSKGCRIVDKVHDVNFHKIPTGESALTISYATPNSGGASAIDETITLQGNVFVMNESGKTIQAFSCN